MANQGDKVLTVEEEQALLRPIDERVSAIQAKIDELRRDGTDRVVKLQGDIDATKRDRILTKEEREQAIAGYRASLPPQRLSRRATRSRWPALSLRPKATSKSTTQRYLEPVRESCARRVLAEDRCYRPTSRRSRTSTARTSLVSPIAPRSRTRTTSTRTGASTPRWSLRRRCSRSRMRACGLQLRVSPHRPPAYVQVHVCAASGPKVGELQVHLRPQAVPPQERPLYIVILLVFIFLCAITPVVKGTQLLTYQNILNILQQASPRMFPALGVAGLILLTGTDLSIGRMMGMGMTAATIIMHQGVNTGSVFGHVFDFTGMPLVARIVLALVVCVALCTLFTSIAGFFTARFKMPVHLDHGQHAHHLWPGHICHQGSRLAPSTPPSPTW